MRTLTLALLLLLVLGAISAQYLSFVGPSDTPLAGAVITWGDCKLCEIDCELNGILTCPKPGAKRYYRYGCHKKAYCFDLASFHPRDYDTAVAFCMSKNNCTVSKAGITDNRQNNYADNNPAVVRRNQAEAAVLAENAFINAAIGDVSKRMTVERRKSDCVQYYGFTYPSNTDRQFYGNLKQEFQNRWKSDDQVYQEVRQECSYAYLVMEEFETLVAAKANTMFQNSYSQVSLEAGYTLIKSKLFSIARIPQVFMYYTKLIGDAYDRWTELYTDANAMAAFITQANNEIAKIPNYLGEKAITEAQATSKNLVLDPLDEPFRYMPITAAHMRYLKQQNDFEGGLRAVQLLNLVNKYTDAAIEQLIKYQYIYPNREVQTYLSPTAEGNFLNEYVALLTKFDADYVKDNDIRIGFDRTISTKRVPTDMVLRLLFQGLYRDKLIMFTLSKGTNLPDITIDFPALEEFRIKQIAFPIWFRLPETVQSNPVGEVRRSWVFTRAMLERYNLYPAKANLAQLVSDALKAAGFYTFIF